MTNIAAPRIPVAAAYNSTVIPTAPCMGGFSAGLTLPQIGLAGGSSKEAKNCALLETARSFDANNERLAACKVKITSKYSKAAGVTLADCMQQELVAAPPIAVAAPAPTPTIIVVPAATPAVPVAAVPVAVAPSPSLVAVCDRLSNECKQYLDDASNWKKQNDGRVIIYAAMTNYPVANAMRLYLKHSGLTSEDILVEMNEHSRLSAGVGIGYER